MDEDGLDWWYEEGLNRDLGEPGYTWYSELPEDDPRFYIPHWWELPDKPGKPWPSEEDLVDYRGQEKWELRGAVEDALRAEQGQWVQQDFDQAIQQALKAQQGPQEPS